MKAVFVLVDALGWTYVKDRAFLSDILPDRAELRTVLGFSSGAIPSILSGQLPEKSNRWNLFYYSPTTSPFRWVRWFSFLPDPLLNNRVVRRVVRIVSQKLSRFGGYFQIYGVPLQLLPYLDIAEKTDIYKPGGVPNSIFDELERLGVLYRSYSYHQGSDQQLIEMAERDLASPDIDFCFLYLSELDAFLHHSCSDREGVDAVLKKYDRWLHNVYAAAKQNCDGEFGFYVFSDHGMTPKRYGFDVIGEIASLGLTLRKDYIALYDSTMARFWFFNPNARDQVDRKLATLPCGHILSPAEQSSLGIRFEDNRYGDTIFLLNPGILIEPSFMGTLAPPGMHGFHPDDLYSSACFLSATAPAHPPRLITDVHFLMLEWAHRLKEAAHAHA